MFFETSLVDAIQITIFGLVVVARMHMTSYVAKKRVLGFGISCVAGVCYMSLMYYMGLYILAAMEIIVLCLDARGVYNNLKKDEILEEKSEKNDVSIMEK